MKSFLFKFRWLTGWQWKEADTAALRRGRMRPDCPYRRCRSHRKLRDLRRYPSGRLHFPTINTRFIRIRIRLRMRRRHRGRVIEPPTVRVHPPPEPSAPSRCRIGRRRVISPSDLLTSAWPILRPTPSAKLSGIDSFITITNNDFIEWIHTD